MLASFMRLGRPWRRSRSRTSVTVPEATTLYQVAQENLETLYGAVDDGAVKVALPRFVKK